MASADSISEVQTETLTKNITKMGHVPLAAGRAPFPFGASAFILKDVGLNSAPEISPLHHVQKTVIATVERPN